MLFNGKRVYKNAFFSNNKLGLTAEYPATRTNFFVADYVRYAVSDTCKSARFLSSWLRGTRYAVSDIYRRKSCRNSWLRGTQ